MKLTWDEADAGFFFGVLLGWNVRVNETDGAVTGLSREAIELDGTRIPWESVERLHIY